MGELQHGVYDDECEGLTKEEINAFYGFEEDGESQVLEESPDRSDKNDSDNDGNLEELEMYEESEDNVIDVINFPFIKSLT